jgi:hypothetical protein
MCDDHCFWKKRSRRVGDLTSNVNNSTTTRPFDLKTQRTPSWRSPLDGDEEFRRIRCVLVSLFDLPPKQRSQLHSLTSTLNNSTRNGPFRLHYGLFFSWRSPLDGREEFPVLGGDLVSLFDVPPERSSQIHSLTSTVNNSMRNGPFDLKTQRTLSWRSPLDGDEEFRWLGSDSVPLFEVSQERLSQLYSRTSTLNNSGRNGPFRLHYGLFFS